WKYTHAIAPERAEQLNKRFAHALNADKGGWDIGQVLRYPGSINHKYASKPQARLVSVRDDVTYDPDWLDAILPPLPDDRPDRPRPKPDNHGWTESDDAFEPIDDDIEPPVRLDAYALPVWLGSVPRRHEDDRIDRSGSLCHIARVLYNAGATHRTIVA